MKSRGAYRRKRSSVSTLFSMLMFAIAAVCTGTTCYETYTAGTCSDRLQVDWCVPDEHNTQLCEDLVMGLDVEITHTREAEEGGNQEPIKSIEDGTIEYKKYRCDPILSGGEPTEWTTCVYKGIHQLTCYGMAPEGPACVQ